MTKSVTPRELAERLAKECLDQGLYFGNGHIYRCTIEELESFTRRVMVAAIGEAMHEAADIAARMTDNSPAFIADAIRDAAKELPND